MADKKISALDPASLPLAGTEVIPIVQGGETKKVAISQLSGAVDSVNGQTGVVVLDAEDVGAVPRGGTTAGNPITGTLQMADGTEIYSENSTKSSIFFEDGYLYIKFLNALSEESQFQLNDLALSISSLTTGFRGLIGLQDFTPNITDLDYTQKKYVDTKAPLNPRVQSVTSSATVTPTSTNDMVIITAQATGLTLANPTGTFSEAQALMIRIKDNGTARSITFGSNYRAIGVTLPTTTVIGKTLYLGIIYNSIDGKWDVLGTPQQA